MFRGLARSSSVTEVLYRFRAATDNVCPALISVTPQTGRCTLVAERTAGERRRCNTTKLHQTDDGTTVVLTQSSLAGGVSAADRDSRADYEKNWTTVLEGLKATVEG